MGLLRPLALDAPDAHLSDLLNAVRLQSDLYRRSGQPSHALEAVLHLARNLPAPGQEVPPQLSELVGDRYADLGEPDQSAAWWRGQRVATVLAGGASEKCLRPLADKLDSAGKTGAAVAALRLASA